MSDLILPNFNTENLDTYSNDDTYNPSIGDTLAEQWNKSWYGSNFTHNIWQGVADVYDDTVHAKNVTKDQANIQGSKYGLKYDSAISQEHLERDIATRQHIQNADVVLSHSKHTTIATAASLAYGVVDPVAALVWTGSEMAASAAAVPSGFSSYIAASGAASGILAGMDAWTAHERGQEYTTKDAAQDILVGTAMGVAVPLLSKGVRKLWSRRGAAIDVLKPHRVAVHEPVIHDQASTVEALNDGLKNPNIESSVYDSSRANIFEDLAKDPSSEAYRKEYESYIEFEKSEDKIGSAKKLMNDLDVPYNLRYNGKKLSSSELSDKLTTLDDDKALKLAKAIRNDILLKTVSEHINSLMPSNAQYNKAEAKAMAEATLDGHVRREMLQDQPVVQGDNHKLTSAEHAAYKQEVQQKFSQDNSVFNTPDHAPAVPAETVTPKAMGGHVDPAVADRISIDHGDMPDEQAVNTEIHKALEEYNTCRRG